MVGSDRNLNRAGGGGVLRILPIYLDLPVVDSIVPIILVVLLAHSFELRSSLGHHDVGRAGGRKRKTIDVGIIQEIDTIDDDALLGGLFALEHLRPVDDAYSPSGSGVLLSA